MRILAVFLVTLVLVASVNQIDPTRQIRPPVTSTVVFATHDQLHAGYFACLPSGGIPAYRCNFNGKNREVSSYTVGMELLFVPDVDCAGACTLVIDELNAPIALKATDGTTDATFVHGHGYHIFFTPTGVWRLVG